MRRALHYFASYPSCPSCPYCQLSSLPYLSGWTACRHKNLWGCLYHFAASRYLLVSVVCHISGNSFQFGHAISHTPVKNYDYDTNHVNYNEEKITYLIQFYFE